MDRSKTGVEAGSIEHRGSGEVPGSTVAEEAGKLPFVVHTVVEAAAEKVMHIGVGEAEVLARVTQQRQVVEEIGTDSEQAVAAG